MWLTACRLLDWATQPGEKAATWGANDTYIEGVGFGQEGGSWVNRDSYLPDVPSLEAEIFTSRIKPHFKYYKEPLEQVAPQEAPAKMLVGGTTNLVGSTKRFQHLEPSNDVHQALKRGLGAVMKPASLMRRKKSSSTEQPPSIFVPTDVEEG